MNRAAAEGAPAPSLLLFTFTRAARDELTDRVRSSPDFEGLAPHLRIATLNAWGYRRLRASQHTLRLLTSKRDLNYALLNVLRPVWSTRENLKSVLGDSRAYRAARVLMEIMDRMKSLGFRHWELNDLASVHAVIERLEAIGMDAHVTYLDRTLTGLGVLPESDDRTFSERMHEHFIPFWCEALDALYQRNTITLEDQKYLALRDISEQLASGRTWRGAAGYSAILVDEFQDINPLDLDLLKALSAITAAPLTIVGDDDQAIYEWRGASPSFILEPETHIAPSFTTCILDTNYRSPRNIVEHSQALIRHNERRVDKNVRAHQDTLAQIEVRSVTDIRSAIAVVVPLVKQLQADPKTSHRIALIGRKRAQLIPYQIAFAAENIEFFAAEDLSIFLSNAFESLVKALETRSAVGARVGQAWGFEPASMTLALCEMVGRFPLKKADHTALRSHLQRARPDTLNDALTALRRYEGNLPGSPGACADAIAALYQAEDVQGALHVLGDHFEGLQQDYARAEDDIYYSDPPFLHLADFAADYGAEFGRFIGDLRAARDTLAAPSADDEASDPSLHRPLHLMTALRAKGKEFDTVIILDANAGIWPSRLATTERALEAERRVFYVAVTRAKKHLLCLVASIVGGELGIPSPYLSEMALG